MYRGSCYNAYQGSAVCPVPSAPGFLCLQVVLNITNTFDSSFSRWTVGLGLEHQLNELRVAAGLEEEARFRTRARNLDYAQLVQPEVAALHHASLPATADTVVMNCGVGAVLLLVFS